MGFMEYGQWRNRPPLQKADPDIYTDPIVFRNRVTFQGPDTQIVIVDGVLTGYGTGPSVDHGALGGLGDDDHTQYHTNARGDARYLKLTGGDLTGLLTITQTEEALRLVGGAGSALYQTFHREGGGRTAYIGHGLNSDDFYIVNDGGDIVIEAEQSGVASADIILRADDATGTQRSRIFVDGDGFTYLYGRTGSTIMTIDFNEADMAAALNMNDNTLYGPKDPTDGLHVGDRDYNDARYVLSSADLFVLIAGDTMTGPLQVPGGSSAAPGLAVGAADSGLYKLSADVISVALGGTAGWHFYGPGLAAGSTDLFTGAGVQNAALKKGNSTAAAPGFTFRDDQDTGVHSKWDDILELVAGGVTHLTVRTTGVEITGLLYGADDPTGDTHIGDRAYNDARYASSGGVLDYLPLAGGTMTGPIIMTNTGDYIAGSSQTALDLWGGPGAQGARIELWSSDNVTFGDQAFYDAEKHNFRYSSGAALLYIGSSGIVMQGGWIQSPADPTAGTHVGDRDYNDARYVEIAGDTMTGALVLDGATGSVLDLYADAGEADYISMYRDATQVMRLGRTSSGDDDVYLYADEGRLTLASQESTGGELRFMATDSGDTLRDRFWIFGASGDIIFYNNSAAATLLWDESDSRWEFLTAVNMGGNEITDVATISSSDNPITIHANSSGASAQDIYLQADDSGGSLRTRIEIRGDHDMRFYDDAGNAVAIFDTGGINIYQGIYLNGNQIVGMTGSLISAQNFKLTLTTGAIKDGNNVNWIIRWSGANWQINDSLAAPTILWSESTTTLLLGRAGGSETIDLQANNISDATIISSSDNPITIRATSSGASPQDVYLQADDSGGTLRSRIWIDGNGHIYFYDTAGAERLTIQTGGLNVTGVLSGVTDPAAGTHVGDRDYNDARYLLAYGEISAVDQATATTISVAGTPVQVTIFDTNGLSNNTTPDHTNDHITVNATGVYLITVSATVNSVAGAASRFQMTVEKNNGATAVGALHCDRHIGGGGATSGVISMSGLATLTATDTIEVWIENETNTQNYVVENITLTLVQVG